MDLAGLGYPGQIGEWRRWKENSGAARAVGLLNLSPVARGWNLDSTPRP